MKPPMGLVNQSNGNLELYARAVDVARIADYIRLNPFSSEECEDDTYYNIGEATWSNLQEEIRQFVIDNGGQATVIPKTAIRFDKTKLKEVLESNEKIDPELDANAYTLPPGGMVFNQNTFATIRFDNSYLENATDLSIVMTTAHEYVHVFLIYLYTTGDLLNYYPSYINLNSAFQSFENNPTNDNSELLEEAMHDVYNDFLDWIIQSVYTYAVNNSIEGASESYCNKLVIGAHQYTAAFQALTETQQTEYSTITSNEEHGTEQAKGTTCD